MKVVRIYPKTNFHTFLHSDTLWGNLIYAYRMLYGVEETSKLLNKYLSGEIPFIVSSIFPFEIKKLNNKDSIIYYLPKPITGINLHDANNPEEMAYMKEFKKVRYIDKEMFEEYLKGNYDDNLLFERFYKWKKAEDELRDLEEKRTKDVNKIKTLENDIKKNQFNFAKGLTPTFNLHNSIDRMNGSTLQADGKGQLYWEEEFASFGNIVKNFDDKINGIFFLVEGINDKLIEAPLRLLSHIGIGGNKSIGKGSFTFEIDNFSFSPITDSNSVVSLSLYHPNSEEIKKLKNNGYSLFYDITTRIGKVGRDFNLEFNEKNPVICFTEGSSFLIKEPLNGQIVPTAKYDEQNKIYSNYLFFGVKANLRLQ